MNKRSQKGGSGMAKNKIKLYWILLLMLLYTGSLVLGVGETQARYDSVAIGTAFLESQPVEIISDCLVGPEDPAVTVLLGEVNQPIDVKFWLKSVGADAKGDLAWGILDAEEAEYLELTMYAYDGRELTADEAEGVELVKDEKMELTLSIRPTTDALNTPHDMMKINVIVTWGEEMWGTFQVILPAVQEQPSDDQSESTTEEDPEEEPSDNDEIVEEEDPEEEPDENLIETVLSEKETDLQEEPEAISQEEPENGDEGDPDQTEKTDLELEPIVEPPEADPENPEEYEEEESPIQLKTVPNSDPGEMIPLYLKVSDDITSVRLGTENTVDGETSFHPFPDRTRFSLDGGKSFYMMHTGYYVNFMLEAPAAEEMTTDELLGTTESTVLLDFRYAQLDSNPALNFAMEAYNDTTILEKTQVQTMLNGKRFFSDKVLPVSETDTTPTESQDKIRYEKKILNRDCYMELTFPQTWEEADLEYSVEILTMTEDGQLAYEIVELSEEALTATYTRNAEEHKLELRIGEKLPQAGTYRLNMNWKYKGVCFKQMQTTFFINYSEYFDKDLSSQGVQTND